MNDLVSVDLPGRQTNKIIVKEHAILSLPLPPLLRRQPLPALRGSFELVDVFVETIRFLRYTPKQYAAIVEVSSTWMYNSVFCKEFTGVKKCDAEGCGNCRVGSPRMYRDIEADWLDLSLHSLSGILDAAFLCHSIVACGRWPVYRLKLDPRFADAVVAQLFPSLEAVQQSIFCDLRELDLSFTQITESALEKLLPCFPALRSLNLGDCRNFIDPRTGQHATCSKLQSLDLPCSAVETLRDVDRCASLQRVDLSCSSITDDALETLSRCPQLGVVKLAGCERITAAGFAHLAACPLLEEVTLPGYDGDSSLIALLKCARLRTLAGNGRNAANFGTLLSGSHLASLALSHLSSSCAQDALADIAQCRQLLKLQLSEGTFTELPSFAACAQLQSVNLMTCKTLSGSLTSFATNTKLTELVCCSCDAVAHVDVSGCVALRRLHATACSKLTETTGLDKCLCLETATLSNCPRWSLTRQQLESLRSRPVAWPLLTFLDVAGSTLADERTVSVFASCPLLKDVNLVYCRALGTLRPFSRCRKLERVSLSSFAQAMPRDTLAAFANCPRLHTLVFTRWHQRLDLSPLASCRRLQTLSFSNCDSLTETDLEPLAQCPLLREVEVSSCRKLKRAALQNLQERLSRCKISGMCV